MTEAEVKDNKISFTNGFRLVMIIFGLAWAVTCAVSAYAYVVVLPTMAKNIIENDKKYTQQITDNHVATAENRQIMVAIKDDLKEIKALLRRTAPYERKE